MKTIVIASNNPVKIQAAVNAFQRLFPEESFEAQTACVPSGVSHQPMSSEETRTGALNRARTAQEAHPEADYWVGIEGGVENEDDRLAAFAWIAVISPLTTGLARTGAFFLPPAIVELVKQGKELGEADDIVFGLSNSKQAMGAIGILTGGVVDRAELYEQGIILALVAFRNPELYSPNC